MEELSDEESFMLVFPCFSLKSKNGKGGVIQPFNDGSIAAVILTDDDMMARYRKEQGLEDNGAYRMEGALDLWNFLSILPPAVTHIAFDPPASAKNVVLHRTEHLRDYMRRKFSIQE